MAPRSAIEFEQRWLAQLKLLDPSISADPQTLERKIISTGSEIAAEATVDQLVLDYQFDIDSKAGTDLDKFIGLFGWGRLGGKPATGMVTFSRATPATTDILIGAGSQVLQPAGFNNPTPVIFFTTTTVVLSVGQTTVDAPIQSSTFGVLGNVAANTIVQLGVGFSSDISAVTNVLATTGGTDVESDAELRVRFKNTLFRNISGTRDQYLALAIASQFVSKANVIGPISRFIEYLQVPSGGVVTSQIPYSKYTYPFDFYLTDGDIGSEVFYNRGADYTFNSTVPPTVTILNSTMIPSGAIVLLEHAYCSSNSRNDPAYNLQNYIDVYISGQDSTSAMESSLFPTGHAFTGTTTSPYYIGNFTRAKTNQPPVVGNVFQELLWQPVDSLPSIITVNNVNYSENTHYWFAKDATNYKGSRRGRNGIEWAASVATTIGAGTSFVVNYTFNKLPIVINEVTDAHKQVASDVLVHSATQRYFVVNLVIMLTPGFSKDTVDAQIATALGSLMERQTFGAVIQISDLLETTHEVVGVDNVRLASSSDGVGYGIQEYASDGVTPIGASYTNDFALQDSDLPVLQTVVTTRRSQNTW